MIYEGKTTDGKIIYGHIEYMGLVIGIRSEDGTRWTAVDPETVKKVEK